jgi:hypothetical protein
MSGVKEFPVALRGATVATAREYILEKTGKEAIHAYKMFDLDEDTSMLHAAVREGQYTHGAVHTVDGPLVLCENGYHACRDWGDLAGFAPNVDVVVHNVWLGDYIQGANKIVARYLYIGDRFNPESELQTATATTDYAESHYWTILTSGVAGWYTKTCRERESFIGLNGIRRYRSQALYRSLVGRLELILYNGVEIEIRRVNN